MKRILMAAAVLMVAGYRARVHAGGEPPVQRVPERVPGGDRRCRDHSNRDVQGDHQPRRNCNRLRPDVQGTRRRGQAGAHSHRASTEPGRHRPLAVRDGEQPVSGFLDAFVHRRRSVQPARGESHRNADRRRHRCRDGDDSERHRDGFGRRVRAADLIDQGGEDVRERAQLQVRAW